MSWENYNVDMSQFDLGDFGDMLNPMHDTNQINMVCSASRLELVISVTNQYLQNNWNADVLATVNEPFMNGPDWWTTFDPSSMN